MADKRTAYYDKTYKKYDKLQFLRQPANTVVQKAKVSKGQNVIDIGCGTGRATIEAALAVGESGKVVGIDLSDKMLLIAKEKIKERNISNVTFCLGDAENSLDFDTAIFDIVICASTIFFFKDISKVLHEWYRVLKVGGTVAFTSFGSRFLQPVLRPFGELISKYDGQPPPIPIFLERTNTKDKCKRLLMESGFKGINIVTEQLDYYLPDIDNYWQEISLTFVKQRLDNLIHRDLLKLKDEHLNKIATMKTDQGILIELPTIFSTAKKL